MKRRSVALLIETSNGYCRGLLDGICGFARTRGNWSIQLNEQERGARPPAWLKDWQGDGIIARIETDQIGLQLQQLQLPIVDLSAARHLPGIPWADTEDSAISQLAVNHFLDRGFANLAFCGDPGFAWSNARRDHFRQLVRQAQCQYFEYQVTHRYDSSYQWDKVRDSLAAWLVELPKPIAIMACNDYQGQLLLDVCRTCSIGVPEEVAVLGVDNDSLICNLCDPQLTSVVPDTYGTGFEAAELLEHMMNGAAVNRDARLVTQPKGIQIRQSTDTIAIEDQDVAKALIYIRRHAFENIRVADILHQCSISRRALEHRFAKVIGHTPHEELHRIRLQRIKQLLVETDDRISDIAKRTGFEHPEYLTVAFKRSMGMTPTQYRNQIRSDRSK
ncbi:XylR family transcriptional regulator [Roseiconus lacunae]|uniref:DNA-binding transcriptional regulator n=1 Tax=Roseiconus lacunae TaxID=2605694 RepID=A0ABT7PP63_9BACT|nr:DNA-binding transcriptional regulator [Roseiconus lacunae]MCD0460191.1 DNA-binding transcriptional regulator [Roseiconus lacunae]MDM4018299.1 DNA-binding transcriptional regulator [Roseiconus lacunae]WRQ53623.1 DNA-binding transcriptional regulator [Stieleria sp. HD01]